MSIDGEWRLVYSSTLALPLPPPPDALSGALNALPAALRPNAVVSSLQGLLADSPLSPRDVAQKIDVAGRRVVNVVSLAPWPGGPVGSFLASAPGPLGGTVAELQASTVTLELDHAFSVDGEGGSSGRRVAAAGSVVDLNLESVRRALVSTAEAPGDSGGARDSLLGDLIPRDTAYELPGPLSSLAAGSFDTPYVDERVRISRSVSDGTASLPSLPELRVFERIGGVGKAVYATWQEEEDALAAAAAAGEELPEIDDRWQEGGFDEAEAMDFADDGVPD